MDQNELKEIPAAFALLTNLKATTPNQALPLVYLGSLIVSAGASFRAKLDEFLLGGRQMNPS